VAGMTMTALGGTRVHYMKHVVTSSQFVHVNE
jgi:hypothetical protein